MLYIAFLIQIFLKQQLIDIVTIIFTSLIEPQVT